MIYNSPNVQKSIALFKFNNRKIKIGKIYLLAIEQNYNLYKLI